MKRDLDLERDILLAIEAHESAESYVDFSRLDYPKEQVGYQVGILGEAGLAVVHDARTDDEPFDWCADRLTREGHEYLDAIRDPEIWRRTKDGARKIGSFSLETLGELAKALAREKLKTLTGGAFDF